MSDDKSFEEILAEEKAELATEREREAERLRQEREKQLRKQAAITHESLYGCFARPDLDSESETTASLQAMQAAQAVLDGQDVPASSAPTNPSASAETLPFNWNSLTDFQKEIMNMVAFSGGRFVLEPFGAVRDKAFGRMKREYEAQQGGNAPASSEPAAEPDSSGTSEPDSQSDDQAQPPAAEPAQADAQQGESTSAPASNPSPSQPATKKPTLKDRLKGGLDRALGEKTE